MAYGKSWLKSSNNQISYRRTPYILRQVYIIDIGKDEFSCWIEMSILSVCEKMMYISMSPG